MAFATLEDETGSVSVTIFPNLYQKIESMEIEGKIWLVVGTPNDGRRGELEVIADRITDPKQSMVELPKVVLYLKVPKYQDNEQKLNSLYELIETSPGNTPVIVYRETEKQALLLKSNRWINFDESIKQKLITFLGEKNVFLKKGH